MKTNIVLDLRKAIILLVTGIAIATIFASAAVMDIYPNKGFLAFFLAFAWIYLFLRANSWLVEVEEAEEDEKL